MGLNRIVKILQEQANDGPKQDSQNSTGAIKPMGLNRIVKILQDQANQWV